MNNTGVSKTTILLSEMLVILGLCSGCASFSRKSRVVVRDADTAQRLKAVSMTDFYITGGCLSEVMGFWLANCYRCGYTYCVDRVFTERNIEYTVSFKDTPLTAKLLNPDNKENVFDWELTDVSPNITWSEYNNISSFKFLEILMGLINGYAVVDDEIIRIEIPQSDETNLELWGHCINVEKHGVCLSIELCGDRAVAHFDNLEVFILDKKLIVNDVVYEQFASDDTVHIGEHELVSINGTIQNGRPITDAELERMSPVVKYNIELNGCSVIIYARKFSGVYHPNLWEDDSVIEADGIKVGIAKNMLIVNGEMCVEISRGDMLLIKDGEVFLNEKEVAKTSDR